GGGTDRFGVGAGVGVGVSAQGVDELGHLLVALDAREGSLGVEHAGGGPAQHHLPVAQRVTLRLVVRAMEIIDSTGFDVVSVLASRPSMPRRATVNISSSPSRSDAAAPGWLFSSCAARLFALRSPVSGSAWPNA